MKEAGVRGEGEKCRELKEWKGDECYIRRRRRRVYELRFKYKKGRRRLVGMGKILKKGRRRMRWE